jgi:hypothetical protein
MVTYITMPVRLNISPSFWNHRHHPSARRPRPLLRTARPGAEAAPRLNRATTWHSTGCPRECDGFPALGRRTPRSTIGRLP